MKSQKCYDIIVLIELQYEILEMIIVKPNKEQILLNSFEVLKDDVEENHEQIASILTQLEEHQPDTVIILWKYLLESHWKDVIEDREVYDSIGYQLTNEIIGQLANSESFKNFEPYFFNEPKILQAVFQYAPVIDWTTVGIIGLQIKKKKFDIANKLMEYMFSNQKNDFNDLNNNHNFSYYDVFKTIIQDFLLKEVQYPGQSFYWGCDCNDEEIYDFLSYWSNEVTDKKVKAKIDVVLSELL